MTGTELFYVIATIILGTVAVNVAISIIRQRFTKKQHVFFDAHWERRIDEEEAEEAEMLRKYRASSTISSKRGFLSRLGVREAFVESKQSEEDMVNSLTALMKDLRHYFDHVTYFGTHTAKARENDACLYARYRQNGISQCIGEVASLKQTQHGVQLLVNLTSTDATFIQEHGWGAASGRRDLATISSAAKATEMVMPLPRNMQELNTVTRPILEAAVCCVAGVEQCA